MVTLSKLFIQFSVDWWSCVPFLLFAWSQTMVEVMKIMVTSFRGSQACTATLTARNPESGHHWPTPPLESPGNFWASLGQPLVGSLVIFPGSLWTRFYLYSPRVYFPVLCKFWQLYGGVNGDLQEGLCRTQVCCPSPPQEMLKHSSQSLWGPWVLVCIRFVWVLWASLAVKGFETWICLSYHPVGASPLTLGMGYLLIGGHLTH